MHDNLLTVKEVAQVLKVSPATVYEYIHNDSMRAVKFARDFRIEKKELELFINKHRT